MKTLKVNTKLAKEYLELAKDIHFSFLQAKPLLFPYDERGIVLDLGHKAYTTYASIPISSSGINGEKFIDDDFEGVCISYFVAQRKNDEDDYEMICLRKDELGDEEFLHLALVGNAVIEYSTISFVFSRRYKKKTKILSLLNSKKQPSLYSLKVELIISALNADRSELIDDINNIQLRSIYVTLSALEEGTIVKLNIYPELKTIELV